MNLKTQLGLPIVLALGLLLAACDNNTPPAPAANTPAPAAEAAAAAKAAEEKKAAEAAAAAKAAEEKKAAEAAAATKAAEEKKAAEAAAAAKGAADAAAAVEAAPTMEAAPGVLPATGLKPDTLLAAKADTSSIAYLGVWAPDAAACATVDQAGATGYVVITAISVRQGSDITIIDAAPLADGRVTLTAGDKTIELSMPTADQLQVGSGTPLVRCAAN